MSNARAYTSQQLGMRVSSPEMHSLTFVVALCQIGAIVPWNYPFHNVFNPLVAAMYAGNGIVIKVIEVLTQLAGALAFRALLP